MDHPLYVGIDLGTTNSAAAIFDGDKVQLVRGAQGGSLTPSVVRIDARGNAIVGARARRFLETDPDNTRAEFKRLMGTRHTLAFAASKLSKRPEELAALVLQSLRHDVRDQVGVEPRFAVVAVPALFELPQSAATAEAARIAGFERIELIQEPVASAIAAGWSAKDASGPWLVYDLGGGTFDVSLLETKDGVLRVVGHDGDNFLGGRDFDAAIADWAIGRVASERGITIARSDPAHAAGVRRLRLAAEEAKIELARAAESTLSVLSVFVVDGEPIDVDLVLESSIFAALASPLIDRSVAICLRLLAAHGLEPSQLSRIVLVGGPTAFPLLRDRVQAALIAPVTGGLDPMTLVAQGAALYAASAGLDGRPKKASGKPTGPRVWLQYPAVSADVAPYVVGKIVDAASDGVGGKVITKIVLRRADGAWSGEPEAIDEDGTFAASVSLAPRTANVFHVEGLDAKGVVIALDPETISITHGLTVGDPPLPRSVGIALANGKVHVFLERGAPLPMRRTFTLTTVEAVVPGSNALALRVPIVQGDFALAHLCRLVGTLEIAAKDVTATLAAGSPIEVTLAVDRGGAMTASAHVASLGQTFDGVAHLSVPVMSPSELVSKIAETRRRVEAIHAELFVRTDEAARRALQRLDRLLDDAASDGERALGGDADSLEKSRRMLLDVDAGLAEVENARAWPQLAADAHSRMSWAIGWVARYGTASERDACDRAMVAIRRALDARDAPEIERQLRTVRQIGVGAYYRAPGAYEEQLDYASSRLAEAIDVPKARALVKEGQAARAKDDRPTLERVVHALLALMPPKQEERVRAHGSGVR